MIEAGKGNVDVAKASFEETKAEIDITVGAVVGFVESAGRLKDFTATHQACTRDGRHVAHRDEASEIALAVREAPAVSVTRGSANSHDDPCVLNCPVRVEEKRTDGADCRPLGLLHQDFQPVAGNN